MAVLREWRAEVRRERIDEYIAYVEATGIAGYRTAPGNLWAALAVRHLDDSRSEIVTLSVWRSREDMASFAGDPIDRARYFPEDDAFLVTRPDTVGIYETSLSD